MPFESYRHLASYLSDLVPTRPAEMRAMESYAEESNFPIIGPAAGYFCYQVARMIDARRVFELGSGYGYSTAWFARAVRDNGGGVVHHVVWDEDLSRRARGHLDKLGLSDIVKYSVGEAVQTLRETKETFDLIFNDIDKQGYPESLAAVAPKLRSGGVLIVDNALWSGRVLDDKVHDSNTKAVRELTRMVTSDPGWLASIVPIRDGLLVARKQ